MLNRLASCRVILSLAVAVSLSGAHAFGQEAEAKKASIDPSGTWRWQRERNGEVMKSRLDICPKEEGKFEAKLQSRFGEQKSKELKLDGDKLSVKFEGEYNGQTYRLEFTGTIKGDEITGNTKMSSDQGSREFPWTAKRSVELADLVGKWQLRIETPNGDILEPGLAIAKQADACEATYTWEDKKIPVKDLKVEDNNLLFTIVTDMDGQELTATFKGRPTGDKLQGRVKYNLGGQEGELDFTGKCNAEK